MTIDQFLELKQLIEEELEAIKAGARADGVITSSPQFRNLLKQYKIRLLQENDMTLDEYDLFDAQFKEEKEKKAIPVVNVVGATHVEEIKKEITQVEETEKERARELEQQRVKDLNELVGKIESINWKTLGEKPEVLDRDYISNEISKAISSLPKPKSDVYNIRPTEKYNDKDLRNDIEDLKERIGRIRAPKEAKLPNIDPIVESMKQDLFNVLDKNINISYMSPLRKAIMGLQGQLDEINSGKVDDETPSGTIDGANTDFKLAYVPKGRIRLYVNGARQQLTGDYTISGNTITFVTAPPAGSVILCDYNK